MRHAFAYAVLPSFIALMSCGPSRTVEISGDTVMTDLQKCEYLWREDDGWAFIAWALDIDGGAEALAIRSGYAPQQRPEPGVTVLLPLPEELSEALENRLDSARLVRDATDALGRRDTLAVRELLGRAMERDPEWSVPAYNLSLILLRQEGPEAVMELLAPVAHKYDAALVQSGIAWNRGGTRSAMRQIEICLMEDDPPYEALAAAALIYTVTGNDYQASRIWREILESPDAEPSIRLMALEYAMLQEERGRRGLN